MLKIFYALFLGLAIVACNQKPQADSPAATITKNIKSICEEPKKLLDDIEKQSCIYETNSIPLAYQQVVKEVNTRQGKKTKLREALPLQNAKDDFNNEQFWVTFNWKNKAEVLITITSEAEETEYLMKQTER